MPPLTNEPDFNFYRRLAADLAHKYYTPKNFIALEDCIDVISEAAILSKGVISNRALFALVFPVAVILTLENSWIFDKPNLNVVHPSEPYPGQLVKIEPEQVTLRLPRNEIKTFARNEIAHGSILRFTLEIAGKCKGPLQILHSARGAIQESRQELN